MAKKLLLKSKISRKHYKADACVVWCFDDRFTKSRKKYFKKLGLKRIDRVMVAGGAKDLTAKGGASDKKYVLKQIATSIRLHHTPLVILTTHSDCGAYGGFAAFKNNPAKEILRHAHDQKRVIATVKKTVPRGVRVESVFVDFEGVWHI